MYSTPVHCSVPHTQTHIYITFLLTVIFVYNGNFPSSAYRPLSPHSFTTSFNLKVTNPLTCMFLGGGRINPEKSLHGHGENRKQKSRKTPDYI